MPRSKVGDASFRAGLKAGREEMRGEALELFREFFMDPELERNSAEYRLVEKLTRRASQELKA